MTIEQAESFAKVKELMNRMADFRDFLATFTDADVEFLQGFCDYYSDYEMQT